MRQKLTGFRGKVTTSYWIKLSHLNILGKPWKFYTLDHQLKIATLQYLVLPFLLHIEWHGWVTTTIGLSSSSQKFAICTLIGQLQSLSSEMFPCCSMTTILELCRALPHTPRTCSCACASLRIGTNRRLTNACCRVKSRNTETVVSHYTGG